MIFFSGRQHLETFSKDIKSSFEHKCFLQLALFLSATSVLSDMSTQKNRKKCKKVKKPNFLAKGEHLEILILYFCRAWKTILASSLSKSN